MDHLQLFDEKLADGLSLLDALLRTPEALAGVLEAAGAVALERAGVILEERFPEERDVSHLYRFAAGPVLPEPHAYDILVDMRVQPREPPRPIHLAR